MLITSYQIIAEGVAYSDMGVLRVPSKKTVARVLAWLQRNEQIQVVAGHFGTTIRIVNWDKYQSDNYGHPQHNKKTGSSSATTRRKRQKPDPYAHLYIEEVNRV
ncbi:MAG: hypothetical protein HQL01_04560 [Nitrospirae bacterium]|nr:hypothetical protein [Nitrospirota bacterium]